MPPPWPGPILEGDGSDRERPAPANAAAAIAVEGEKTINPAMTADR